MKTLASLFLTALLCGCASTTPTAFERKFYDVTTNYVPHIEVMTNYQAVTVPITNFQAVVVLVTNQIGVTVPVTNFQPVTVYETNRVPVTQLVTNQLPQIVLTPNDTAKATAGAGGAVANLAAPGIGGLVTSGILGVLTIWATIRNRQFSKQNDVLSQSAGTLAQIIETAREVMRNTPQGEQAANALTLWMVSHQKETDTIGQIAGIVKGAVNNQEAQNAANQILALIGQDQTTKGKS